MLTSYSRGVCQSHRPSISCCRSTGRRQGAKVIGDGPARSLPTPSPPGHEPVFPRRNPKIPVNFEGPRNGERIRREGHWGTVRREVCLPHPPLTGHRFFPPQRSPKRARRLCPSKTDNAHVYTAPSEMVLTASSRSARSVKKFEDPFRGLSN